MYSENFMRYLIAYQSEDMEPKKQEIKKVSSTNRLMVDLIGVKYAAIPVKHSAK